MVHREYPRHPANFSAPEPVNEVRDNPLNNPSIDISRAFDMLFGAGSQAFSGETVNEGTALSVPAVWAAVNVIAGTIASLPLHLYRDDGDVRVKADKDPLYRVLHDTINADRETSYSWRKKMVSRLLLKGRAFSFIEKNGAGKVTSLWYLDPARVTVKIVAGRKLYTWQDANGRETTYTADEIIDLVWMPGADGVSHIDPIANARHSLGLAIAAERYASIMFENGGVPPLALNGPAMSPAAAGRASTDIQSALKRARDEKRNVLVTPAGYELKEIGFDPSKQQMLELRKFQVIEVARVFNIPPIFLQDLTTGTYSNVEQQDLAFAKHTLTPLLELIEQELNAKLFGARNTANVIEFSMDGLQRGDFASRMTGYQTAVNSAIFTPNEVRAKENMPPLDGGDDLRIQGATVPLDAALSLKAATPPQATTPPQDNTAPPTDLAA